jgi:Cu-processing system permease protein
MIRRILALGFVGLLQLVRTRVYLNLVVAGTVLVVAALAFDELSGGEGGRVLIDVGLAFIALVTSALAGIVSLVTVTREIETKQVHHVLARPLRRAELVLGRFLTTAMLVVATTLLLGGLLGALALSLVPELAPRVLAAAVFCSFEALVVGAIALVFGVASSSTMSALFTLTIFVLGRLTPALRDLLDVGRLEDSRPLFEAVYQVLPHFFAFDLTAWANGSAALDLGRVGSAGVYGVLYVAALLAFACYRFEKRDLL